MKKMERDNENIVEETTDIVKNENNLVRKTCKFNNFGYCKVGKVNCKFYHSEEKCEIFVELGVCFRRSCCKRHPRTCKYNENERQC